MRGEKNASIMYKRLSFFSSKGKGIKLLLRVYISIHKFTDK